MTDEMSFQMPMPEDPQGRLVSVEEAERILLENLQKSQGAYEEAMRNLATFYSQVGDQESAVQVMSRLLVITHDPEKKADYMLVMGQLMEKMGNYKGAVDFYRQAYSMEPVDREVWYLINNNLGFCLNQFEKYAEAEPFCHAAIEIDPERHNAHKNLGQSHEGQGRYAEAARSYVRAVQANAVNRKALDHLEELLEKHGEIKEEIPDIEMQLAKCQEAVDQASRIRREFEQRLNQMMEGQEKDEGE